MFKAAKPKAKAPQAGTKQICKCGTRCEGKTTVDWYYAYINGKRVIVDRDCYEKETAHDTRGERNLKLTPH